jgi:hypothetical protein
VVVDCVAMIAVSPQKDVCTCGCTQFMDNCMLLYMLKFATMLTVVTST